MAVGGSNINQFRMWNHDDTENRNENYCCEEFQLIEVSSGKEEKKVVNDNGERDIEKEQTVEVVEGGASIYCLDFCNKWRNTISLACGDGFIRTYEIKEKS